LHFILHEIKADLVGKQLILLQEATTAGEQHTAPYPKQQPSLSNTPQTDSRTHSSAHLPLALDLTPSPTRTTNPALRLPTFDPLMSLFTMVATSVESSRNMRHWQMST
jgi:hypothetical protein